MRNLINNIQGLVGKFGKSIVLDKRFLNMLKDVYNFRDNPKLLIILEELYTQGCIRKIYNSSKKTIQKDIKSIVAKERHQMSVEDDDITMVLYSFAIGINIIDYNDYISRNDKAPKNKKGKNIFFVIKSFLKRLYNSIDYTNAKIMSSFLLTTFVGLLLFYICEENEWWIFFCTIVLSLGDIVLGTWWASKTWLDNLNKKGNISVFCACGTIGTLKSCVPLFYLNEETSFFAILLVLAIAFLWGSFTVVMILEQSAKYKWQQIIFTRNYTVTTSLMLLIISSFVFLAPIRGCIENVINQNIRQEHSKIERNLGYKTFCLNNNLPYIPNTTAGLQKRIGIDSLGTKLEAITFKDKFYTDTTDIELIAYKGALIKITLNPCVLGMSEDVIKLYIQKYGTPENQLRQINFFENPLRMFMNPWSWDTDEYLWSYKNGTIKIYCGSSFSISYISRVYSKLELEEHIREENKIKARERKEKLQNEISEQRYKDEIKKEEELKKQSYTRTGKDI